MSIALLRPPDLPALALSLPSTTTRPRSRTNTATSASTSGGASLSINSHALAWDQTYLRITYLVGTMGPSSPTPATSPETEHPRPFADDYDEEVREKRATATAAAVVVKTTAATAAAEKDRSWPAVPREKARRKRAQIQTWCAEVALHGREAPCACACAVGASAAVPASTPAAAAAMAECDVCEVCRRPPPEVLPPAAAVVLPSRGLKKALAWLGRRTRRRRGGAAALDDEDDVLRGLRIVRTEMYRADLPAWEDEAGGGVNAVVVVEPGVGTKKKLPSRSDEGDEDRDVDLDDLSGSSRQNKGLLETDARLRRAQRLLDKGHGRRLPTGPCSSGTDKELRP